MDPKIAARFNDNILNCARERFDIQADRIRLLDGFESFMYRFERHDGEFILRIGHSGRRSPAMIHGEVDWINFLSDHGVTVARAILSRNGKLVEPVDDGQGGQFLCTAFVRAPGAEIRREQINEQFFGAYGSLLGKMHALSKTYTPSNPAWRREAWDGESNNTIDRQLPPAETAMRKLYDNLFAYLQGLPQDADSYGMIHQDAHPGNFFVDENYTITLFDFDDCVYGHFIYDIAMVIFYTALQEKDPPAFMERFLSAFLTAYSRENCLDPRWLKEIPHFLKLREIDLFAAIRFTFGEHPADAWAARYMQGRRDRIEQEIPFLEFDWEAMARYL